jgi:hypothetical protein
LYAILVVLTSIQTFGSVVYLAYPILY